MLAQHPIGSCCSRPRFNTVGGVDHSTSNDTWNARRLVNGIRTVGGTTAAIAMISIVAVVAVVFGWVLPLLSN